MIADAAFELIDFLGTIAFAVSGAMVACQKNTDLFGVIFLSEITALGGGMTRDIILAQIPFILVKHIYALAALLGSAAYYIPHCLRCDETLSMVLGISVTFVLRCLAMRFHWNLPRPMPESGE